jgi:hypothetical protein
LSTLFKQLWPLIKTKVKDPTSLLRQINGGVVEDICDKENVAHQNQIIEDLEAKALSYKKREK